METPRIMKSRFRSDSATAPPPLEKGRSAREASRVGIKGSRFNLTKLKTARARRLRRDSTEVEMKLWQSLRNKQLGVDFRRQHPAGPYTLDFYCPALRLAVELDGGQHAESQCDRARDAWLRERGVTTLRFWNSDVTANVAGVLEVIAAKIAEMKTSDLTPTRRWRADLPLSGGGDSRQRGA